MFKIFFHIIGLTLLLQFFSGCDLLYPPAYYNEIVGKSGGSGGGAGSSSGNKSWKVIGTAGFSANSPEGQIQMKINSSGNPVLAFPKPAFGTLYLDLFNGTFWNEYSYAVGSSGSPEVGLALSNQTDPYLVTDSYGASSGELLFFNGSSIVSLTTTFYPISNVSITVGNGGILAFAGETNTGSYVKEFGGSSGTFGSGTSISQIAIGYSGGNYFLANNNPPTHGIDVDIAPSISGLLSVRTNLDCPNKFTMAVNGGFVYIFRDSPVTRFIDAVRIDSSGNGSSLISALLSGAQINTYQAAVDNSGNVYITVAEGSTSPFSIRVYKLAGAVWQQVGSDLGTGYYPSIDIAADGTVYIAFSDSSVGGRVTVLDF